MSLRLIGLKLSTSLSTNTPAKVRALLCPFVYLYVSLLVCLSVRLCVCPSRMCVCVPFRYLQVCLSTFMTTSSGSVVRPARKVNPNSLNAGNADYTGYTGYTGYDTREVIVNEAADFAPVQQLPAALEDEFWDYDKQVDLEGRCRVFIETGSQI